MGFMIPSVAALASAVLALSLRRRNSGAARTERARALGDVTTAELVDITRVSMDHRGGDEKTNRAKYSYEVNGKIYKCYVDGQPHPPRTIEICYDRYHGNRYIDPDGHSVADSLISAIPLVVFVVTFLLLN